MVLRVRNTVWNKIPISTMNVKKEIIFAKPRLVVSDWGNK